MDIQDIYQDKTPNEKRFISEGALDENIYYPLGNTYFIYNSLKQIPLMKKSELEFEKFLKTEQIEYAVKFLQIEALKKFITKNYIHHNRFENPFFMFRYSNYPIEHNIDAFKQIVQILIDNYDNWIELIKKTLPYYTKTYEYIGTILCGYLLVDENNCCYVCLTTEPSEMLLSPCLCKEKAHAECFVKMHSVKKLDICGVCNSKYKIGKPFQRQMSLIGDIQENPKLIFPSNDMYYEPLMSSRPLVKYTGLNRLTMAIIYLQPERVSELLKEQDILDHINESIDETYLWRPIHLCCMSNMPTNNNYFFGDNDKKYQQILYYLLETRKIDLSVKDFFDRTPLENAKRNKLEIVKIFLEKYIENPINLSVIKFLSGC